jgi:dihydrofolate reductase
MARLIYSAICSVDGYTADAGGQFGWAAPDAEVHAFVNDQERPIGTYLYGRRMYEVMAPWQTMDTEPGQGPQTVDFAAIWQAADKVVYSTTLTEVSTPRTRLEPRFDAAAIRQVLAGAKRDVSVGGAHLAAQAIRAGLVDEYQVFVVPHIVGGGTAALPDRARIPLRLVEERRFGNGTVFLRYWSAA